MTSDLLRFTAGGDDYEIDLGRRWLRRLHADSPSGVFMQGWMEYDRLKVVTSEGDAYSRLAHNLEYTLVVFWDPGPDPRVALLGPLQDADAYLHRLVVP